MNDYLDILGDKTASQWLNCAAQLLPKFENTVHVTVSENKSENKVVYHSETS